MSVAAIDILEEAWVIRDSDRVAARAACDRVFQAADEQRPTALARVIACYLDFRERQYGQATQSGLDALAVLEADPSDPWLPRLYNTLGGIHFELGERATCRAYLDQQIRLSQTLGDHTYEALGYHDLGLLHAAVDAQRGIDTLNHARALFQDHGDGQNEAVALYNIANIYQHMGEHALAASYATQALQIVRAQGSDGIGGLLIVHIATHMAEIALAQGVHGEARALLDEARDVAMQRVSAALPHVQFCRGLYHVAVGDDHGAVAQFEATIAEHAASISYELRADCHAALADCYERLGDYRAALQQHRAFAAVRERTFAEISEQKVRALDVIHEVAAARQAVHAERQRNAELQQALQELEQLHATLQAMSQRDPLTGLHNRRYMAEAGSHVLHSAQHNRTPLCAAMIDIDGFKQINDTLGHQIGDTVLQQLSHVVITTLRNTDLIIRYGGEEILVLLPSTSIDAAYGLCERVRITVEQHDWPSIDPALQVTVSIGLAEDDGNTLADLLARADANLYLSKRTGRNRTSLSAQITSR